MARSSATRAPSTTTELLPVPRMPLVCQVSITSMSALGTKNTRTSGAPWASNRGPSPSSTIPNSAAQSAASTALTMSQRPDSR